MSEPITVKAILEKYLQDNGYDGLYRPGCCDCLTGDLAWCTVPNIDWCRAGYRSPCNGPDGPGAPEWCAGDCEYHLGPHKPTGKDQ